MLAGSVHGSRDTRSRYVTARPGTLTLRYSAYFPGRVAAVLSSVHGNHAGSPTGKDRLVSDGEAALLLGVSRSKVEKMRASGALETVHIGASARVRLSDVMQIIRESSG
jgi:excisionase family DNA binding protein